MIYGGISVSFTCRLCETSFDGVGDFIEHKKTDHLQEFQTIKGIVFEERIFSDASQDYCGCSELQLPLPTAPIIIKTETPANTNINTYTNANYENSYSDPEIESQSGNLIFEPKIEIITFENQILENPFVRLERLSSNKIRVLTTSGRSRNRSSRSESIAKPELSGQDDHNFFHSHDGDIVRPSKLFPIPVFEKICKSENATSSDCSQAVTNGATLTNHIKHHQDFVTQNHAVLTVAADCKGDNEITHIITDEDIIPRPFKCPQPNCPKRFRYKESVNHHFASHTGLKPFMCPESNCGQKFTYKFALKMHSKTHSDDKSVIRRRNRRHSKNKLKPAGSLDPVISRRFKCPEPNCESSFSVASYLQSHLFCHSDSKLFKCPVPDCGKAFKQRGSLYKHRAFHANVIVIFTCPYPNCGKSYNVKYSRDRHMKQHE